MSRKPLSLACAAVLAAFSMLPPSGAFAEGGALRTVFDAGRTLLFQTDNVTLTAEAEIRKNGTVFKTVRGTLVQQNADDSIALNFTTLRPDGTTYPSAWQVTGQDGYAYSVDSLEGPFYRVVSFASEPRILSDPEGALESLLSVVSPALEMADRLYPDAARFVEGPEEDLVRIRFPDGGSPALFDVLAETLVRRAAKAYLGLPIEKGPLPVWPDEEEEEGSTLCDDWDQLFSVGWEKLFGEPFPGEEYDYSDWSEEQESRYRAVWELWDRVAEDTRAGRTGGYVFLRGADGSSSWYETYGECILATDSQYLLYDDQERTFLHWLKSHTGDEWDEETLFAALYSGNPALENALGNLYDEMDAGYLAALGNAPFGAVDPSGNLHPMEDPGMYGDYVFETENSITYSTLTRMKTLRLGEVRMDLSLDKQGRLTGAQGDIQLVLTRTDGKEDLITLTLSCTAGNYGTSRVAPFDPETLGLTRYRYRDEEKDLPAEPQAPPSEKVTLNGQDYLLHP